MPESCDAMYRKHDKLSPPPIFLVVPVKFIACPKNLKKNNFFSANFALFSKKNAINR